MIELFIAGVCGATVTFPIIKWYSKRYRSRVAKDEKLALCFILVIVFLMSAKNIYVQEYILVSIECVLYSIYRRRDFRTIHERRELKRIIKAYSKYMNTNWYKPVKRGKIDKNDREKYSKLNTFDEFFEKEYREFDSDERK